MKVYRIIVIVVALVLGISFTAVSFSGSLVQVAINEPATEEYYEFLKEKALKVAKMLDKNALNDETLTADFYFNEDELVVTVESITAKLTTKIPISNYSLSVEDGTIKFQGATDFENVEYEEENQLEPAWWYIVMLIFAGALVALLVYLLFYGFWFSSK